MFHGLGMTKQPASCSLRNALRLSATVGREPLMFHPGILKRMEVSGYFAARMFAPRAEILRPVRAPCQRPAGRPFRAGFPAMVFGSADSDNRRFSRVPRNVPPVPRLKSAYRQCL